jgi:hypothetical protein
MSNQINIMLLCVQHGAPSLPHYPSSILCCAAEVLELTLHDDVYLVMRVRGSKGEGEAGEP